MNALERRFELKLQKTKINPQMMESESGDVSFTDHNVQVRTPGQKVAVTTGGGKVWEGKHIYAEVSQDDVIMQVPARPKEAVVATDQIVCVKIEYDDEVKRINGTSAKEDPSSRYLLVYNGEQLVARINKVERWWVEAAKG
jgi:hypothetical protein